MNKYLQINKIKRDDGKKKTTFTNTEKITKFEIRYLAGATIWNWRRIIAI